MIRFTRLPQGIVAAKFIVEGRTVTVISLKNAWMNLVRKLKLFIGWAGFIDKGRRI